jgi:hypothetical protein
MTHNALECIYLVESLIPMDSAGTDMWQLVSGGWWATESGAQHWIDTQRRVFLIKGSYHIVRYRRGEVVR